MACIDFILFRFLSVFIYIALVTFAIIGTHLYFYAYYYMKKSNIIGAVAILLLAFSVDSGFWAYAEFFRFMNGGYQSWTINPVALIFVKGFLAITLINFVLVSIRKPPLRVNINQKPLFKG